MKQPKLEEVNLPYASTTASFFNDQGAAQGNSFLGKLFRSGRPIQSQAQTPTITESARRQITGGSTGS